MAVQQHAHTVSDSSFGEFADAPTSAAAAFSPIAEPPLAEAEGLGDGDESGFSDFVTAPVTSQPADRSSGSDWGVFQAALPRPPAPPSPPMRDLRPVEARLRLQERNNCTVGPHSETDPLSAPLVGDRLAANAQAQASILPIPSVPDPGPTDNQAHVGQRYQPSSESGWSGSLWRTIGNINLRQIGGQARGAAGEAWNHLPRPHLPAGLFDLTADDPEFQAYQQTLPDKGPSPTPSPRPFRQQVPPSNASKAAPIISGAPGFNVAEDRFENQNWNRGGWTLPSTTASETLSTASSMPSTVSSDAQATATVTSRSSTVSTAVDPLERVRVLAGPSAQATADSRFAHRRAQAVTLRGRYADTREVVRQGLAGQLQAVLPARLQLGRGWRLVYSTDQHGISLQTLYDRVGRSMTQSSASRMAAREGWLRGASSATATAMSADGGSTLSSSGALGEATQASASATDRMPRSGLAMHDAGLVLAVQDTDGNVFGSFINEPIKPQPHYFGSGQSFLWKTVKVPDRTSGEGVFEAGRMLKIFPWSGRNLYACLAQGSSLAFGGGPDGRYGLWLDDELENGVSDVSVTFDNDPLADTTAFPHGDRREQKFECLALEVWAVGVD